MTFQELGLIQPILGALADMGYEHPSPIQERAIPPALKGRDVLGCAQTGTGKTCAFAAPILQLFTARVVEGRPIRALILTPTRELALQIHENLVAYGKNLKLRSAVIFGGVGQNPQVEALKRGVDILVATPGRLTDLHQQGLVDLRSLEIFVLDEADRMLDMGFIHDVKKILHWLPARKQTLFFSATMPPEITELVDSLLHNPVKVAVDPVSSPVEVIEQSLYYVDRGNKSKLLAHLMDELDVKNAVVFTRTKHGANKVAADLAKAGITAAAIHGNKSQTARQQALADFKSGKLRTLVATDIAARGLDIEELSHVFNYNLPDVPETYVHRIGRTGRAGREGTAISFCDINEKDELKAIQRLLGRDIPVVEGHPWPMEIFTPMTRDSKGRLVNPEDAEARAAARERRNQRNAEAKANQQKALEKALERAKAKEEVSVPAELTEPSKKSRRRRKKGSAPAPAAPETVVTSPKTYAQMLRERQNTRPQADEKDVPYTPTSRETTRYTRGVRQSLTLEEALAATAPHYTEEELAQQRSQQRRYNPLGGDSIMDATARLLSGRRKGNSAPAEEKPVQAAAPQEAPKSNNKRPRNRKKPGADAQRQAAPVQNTPKQTAPQKPQRDRKAPKAEQPKRDAAPAQKGKNNKRPRNDRPRRGAPELNRRSGDVKDSTEQPSSLMKPYYLSDT